MREREKERERTKLEFTHRNRFNLSLNYKKRQFLQVLNSYLIGLLDLNFQLWPKDSQYICRDIWLNNVIRIVRHSASCILGSVISFCYSMRPYYDHIHLRCARLRLVAVNVVPTYAAQVAALERSTAGTFTLQYHSTRVTYTSLIAGNRCRVQSAHFSFDWICAELMKKEFQSETNIHIHTHTRAHTTDSNSNRTKPWTSTLLNRIENNLYKFYTLYACYLVNFEF